MLFLRLEGAFLECRVIPDEGFRDEDRADRGAFFLFKSFSLLESQDPSQALGNSSGTLFAFAFYQREVSAPQWFFRTQDWGAHECGWGTTESSLLMSDVYDMMYSRASFSPFNCPG